MKGGFNGLKGKEISLISIVLMSTTILLWTWEKTPGLTSLLPPQTQLQLSPDVDVGGDGSTLPKTESTNKQEELQFNGATQTVSAESSYRRSIDESHTITTTLAEEFHSNVSDEKAETKEVLEAGNNHNAESNVEIHSKLLDEKAEIKEVVDAGNNHNAESLSSPEKINDENHQEEGKNASKEANARTDLVASNHFLKDNENDNWNDVTEHKACNYAKGKWVPDNNRPLYSGFECKQWLSSMWACRLTQRTDFAYENLRWKPKDCQMEEFEGSKFLRRMQNKTLAFVGDSLGRQQFQSLMCMITGGKETADVEDVGNEFGLVLPEGAARPNGWAYRFPSTNTTILYYWSATLCDIEPIDANDTNTDHAMHLDRPPAFLRQFIHKFDVLVLNTGHHWNRGKLKGNRWVMHVGGVPNTDKKIAVIWGAKNLTFHSVVSWVNSQLPKYPGLKVFFRTISPRHFFGGEWNTGGSCDNTTPMSVGKEILDEESTDQNAAHAVKGTAVKLLDITAISQLRDEGHISRFSITAKPGVQDCLHWCLPGVPDTWNELLFTQI